MVKKKSNFIRLPDDTFVFGHNFETFTEVKNNFIVADNCIHDDSWNMDEVSDSTQNNKRLLESYVIFIVIIPSYFS